jgi:hypothetical protein
MPDVSTEVAIATTTLGSAASTITFSSISGSYTDLRLVLVGNTASGASDYGINMIFNNIGERIISVKNCFSVNNLDRFEILQIGTKQRFVVN